MSERFRFFLLHLFICHFVNFLRLKVFLLRILMAPLSSAPCLCVDHAAIFFSRHGGFSRHRHQTPGMTVNLARGRAAMRSPVCGSM